MMKDEFDGDLIDVEIDRTRARPTGKSSRREQTAVYIGGKGRGLGVGGFQVYCGRPNVQKRHKVYY